jgi:diguanylate cyclase (GGDEF)-like protein
MHSRTEFETSGHRSGNTMIVLGLFGLVAPILTFFLAVSSVPQGIKFLVLTFLAVGYLGVCVWSFNRLRQGGAAELSTPPSSDMSQLDASLRSMSEATEFLGPSLKAQDLFRLVSTRVDQFFPFSVSVLFVAAEAPETIVVAQSYGPNAEMLERTEIQVDRGVAGMSWLSREVEVDEDMALERRWVPAELLVDLKSAFAIPLVQDEQPFGVLVLYTDKPVEFDANVRMTLEAIGRRLAPLFLSSMSFERSLSNALTDTLTSLPNERAFNMVLENQLAESHRLRHERPLTVLSIDIKHFAEANQAYGFAAGDRMLAFTAEMLASQLRKMDFLSRASNDEFLIILPTASEKTSTEVIQRIRDRFAAEPFSISETDDTKVWLNFGWATFWQDGETADQLLQNARVRKQQAKAEEPTKILWFPKEYVN